MKYFLSGVLSFCGVIFVSLLDIQPSLAQPSASPDAIIKSLSPRILTLQRADLVRLAKAYSALGNHVSAIGTYNAILTKSPKDFQVKTLIGVEYRLMGKESEAIQVLKEALDINPKYEPAYLESAQIYEKKKNSYELRLIYQDLVSKVGSKPKYLAQLCFLSTQEGLYELSFKYCRMAIQKNPKDPFNHIYLGQAFKETGEIETANKYLRQSASSFPSSAEAQVAYAQFLQEQKNFVLSYAYFEKAARVNSKLHSAYIGLGFTGIELGKYQESLNAFRSACRLNKSTSSDLKKALSLVRLHRTELWSSRFERAADLCGID